MLKGNARPGSAALIVSVLSFIGLFALAEPATAGQGAVAPAGIFGQVTDGTGAILPGVTITATSPALQVPQVQTVTDERGEFRLAPLAIGRYTVTYELAGFQVLRRENVQLTVGFMAKLDQVLNLGAVTETVTVSGASPLVDVTSTAARTEVTREQLDVLPTTRDGLKAFLGQVPGVRTTFEVGMSGLSDGVTFRSYGQTGEPWQMLDGVLLSSPQGAGTGGSHLDFNSIEGTRVQTLGSNAEMPRRGILVDSIVKSGGNQFHSNMVAYGTGHNFEADNVDEELRADGIKGSPQLHFQEDLSANLGGRILRNKLWFFGAASYKAYDRDVLDVFYPDGTPVVLTTRMHYHLEKLSWQMTPGNRLSGFYHAAYDQQLRDASKFTLPESRITATNPVPLGGIQWQGVRGSSLVASLQHGFFDYLAKYDGITHNKVATTDLNTLYVTGDSVNDARRNYAFRHHTKGAVSWYKSDLLAGNHEFKAGFDHLFSWASDSRESRQSGNYQLVYKDGVPFQIVTYSNPVEPKNNDNYVGVYGQDAWTVARRLTLNLGLRYEHDNMYGPEQCRVAGDFAPAECITKVQMNVWNSVAPRLHAAYDLSGDGKTVLKGGWGRFDHLREIVPEGSATNRFSYQASTWDWHDTGNKAYDAGEVNLDPNGPDFRSLSGATLGVPDPNEKQPKTDEFSLTLEREVVANWAVRATGLYSRNFNSTRLLEIYRPPEAYNIPITNPDPGPDGVVKTADDPGTFVTYYEYPASLSAKQFASTMLTNDPRSDSTFKTIEVATTKRLSQGWQFFTAYSATRLNLPFGAAGLSSGTNRLNLNPNAEINVSNQTWEVTYKASGAYTFPYQILGSANFEHRSGAPQARTVLFGGGKTIKSITLNVEPLGSIKLPDTNLLDLRAAKRFGLGSGRSLELRADLFNALNTNSTLTRVVKSGPDYLKTGVPFTGVLAVVQAVVPPRIMHFGAAFTF